MEEMIWARYLWGTGGGSVAEELPSLPWAYWKPPIPGHLGVLMEVSLFDHHWPICDLSQSPPFSPPGRWGLGAESLNFSYGLDFWGPAPILKLSRGPKPPVILLAYKRYHSSDSKGFRSFVLERDKDRVSSFVSYLMLLSTFLASCIILKQISDIIFQRILKQRRETIRFVFYLFIFFKAPLWLGGKEGLRDYFAGSDEREL